MNSQKIIIYSLSWHSRALYRKLKKENRNGRIAFIHGSRQFTSNSKFKIIPKVGDFYFFPNYLMHHVYPFKDSKEERRSISFNAKIDDNIYDVYGGE